MRCFFFFLIVVCFSSVLSFGQKKLSGKIQDYDGGAFLAKVNIRNLNHLDLASVSDTNGRYTITAFKKDSIQLTLAGYQPRILIFTGDNEIWFETVLLTSNRVVLDTITVRQALSDQERNSLEHAQLYSKTLNYQPPKAKLPKKKDLKAGQSLKIEAPLSGLLGKTSKEYKKNKAFKEMYAESESQTFINSRYDTALVTELTGLKNDSLYHFMQAYPMSLQYANTATDLEIKMWIRFNYKEWMERQKP